MRFFIWLLIVVIGSILTDSITTGILLGLVFAFASPTGPARLDNIEAELAKLKTEVERLKKVADPAQTDMPSETASATPLQKTRDSAESATEAVPSENRTAQAAHVRTSPALAGQRFRIPNNGSDTAFGKAGTDMAETAVHADRPSEKPLAAEAQPAAALSGVHAAQVTKPAESMAVKHDRPSENGSVAAQPVSVEVETAGQTPKAENPLLAWFMRGNMLLRAGVVILFLGLAFLLRLASEYIHVSIGTRYVMVAAAGVAATAAGWRLQKRRREYGLVLQGFGVAVMYLTSLAALKLHPLLPAPAVFGTMVALTVLMALLAVRQNALVLAQFALLGGLAAPVLVSDGSGNYLVLFSYLAILNAGVAAIAWFKAWRSLNITGFVGTFTIGAVWGAGAYTPQHFATTEPFLIYHWLLYTLIACLFARRLLRDKPYEGRLKDIPDNASLARMWQTFCAYGLHVDALDSTLLFGTALAAFGLQYPMVAAWEYGAAWSAAGFAAVYALLAAFFRQHERFAVLKQAFAALALLFGTLAVPLAFGQQWTAAVWTVEAALVYLFALQQRQPHTRLIALGVYVLAVLTQLEDYSWADSAAGRMLEGSLFGTVLAAVGGGLMYWLWFARRRNGSAVWEKHFQTAVLSLAVLHAALLPFILFAERGSMVATAVLAAVWAWCARRSGSSVFASATALSGITAGLLLVDVLLLFSSDNFILPALACTVPMLWAAYALQKPPSENFANGFIRNAGRVQLAAALGFGVFAVWNGLGRIETGSLAWLRPTWWTLPLFALPLAVAAKRSGWTQLLCVLPLFTATFAWTAFLYDFPQWPWAGLLVLTAGSALHFYLLNALPSRKHAETLHAASLLLFGTLWTKFVGTLGDAHLGGVWAQLAWAAVPFALWLVLYAKRNGPFIGANRTAYWHIGSAVCAAALAAWLLWVNIVRPSAPAPLPYFPLANPLEIASAAMLWQAFRWLGAWTPQNWPEADKRRIYAVPLALAFVFLSAGVMRVWHFFGGVEWNIATLLASFGLQASLSIVWALTAIVLMVRGNQSRRRTPWVIGASLMGVVVVKLFLVELGNSGGIARIVSFIVVGLLLLLVGWFAPVPPKDGEEKEEKTE